MFTDDELKSFDEQLSLLGITKEKEMKEVLEYFYQLSRILLNF